MRVLSVADNGRLRLSQPSDSHPPGLQDRRQVEEDLPLGRPSGPSRDGPYPTARPKPVHPARPPSTYGYPVEPARGRPFDLSDDSRFVSLVPPTDLSVPSPRLPGRLLSPVTGVTSSVVDGLPRVHGHRGCHDRKVIRLEDTSPGLGLVGLGTETVQRGSRRGTTVVTTDLNRASRRRRHTLRRTDLQHGPPSSIPIPSLGSTYNL